MDASGKMARDYSMQDSLEVKLEALLFASPGPVTIDQLATALEVGPAAVKSALSNLETQYADRGLRIQYHQGGAQMTSAPEYAPEIERLLQLDSQAHLSRAALEVLAIVTYRQPITRPEIDSRGVNSDSSIKTLHRYGLIEEIGRTSGPGRPILYGTSGEFLQHFGISSLDQLPEIEGESQPLAEGSSLPRESGEQSDEPSAEASDHPRDSEQQKNDPSAQATNGS
jgi:segregation and condensation protein B